MTDLRQREPRIKDDAYLKDVRCLCCVVCQSTDCVDAAHIRFSAPGKFNAGVGQKPHDHYVLPLCRYHHNEQHHYPLGERQWWKDKGRDPLRIAANLFKRRGNLEAMLGLIHDLHRKYPDTSEILF